MEPAGGSRPAGKWHDRKMTTTPDRVRVQFPEISSRAWEHPADRAALAALRSLTGFDVVLRTLSGLLSERQHRLLYLASAVRVDDRQFRGVNRLYEQCREVLDVPRRPELYVLQQPMPHALTIGMDRPFIVVTTGLLDLLDDEELRFCLGHEIGHAESGHAVYQTMLLHLAGLARGMGWLPVGGWVLRAMMAALMEWSRKSELSGDRAGLLAGQDRDAALRVQMKLAGGARLDEMDPEVFLAQAADYEATGDLREGVLKLLNIELRSHPFSVLRAAELQRWIDSGEYERMLAGDYPRRGGDRTVSIGEEMRTAARTYRMNFDMSTDPLIRTLRDVGRDFGTAFDAVGQGVAETVANLRDRFTGWRRPGQPPGEGGQAQGEDGRPQGENVWASTDRPSGPATSAPGAPGPETSGSEPSGGGVTPTETDQPGTNRGEAAEPGTTAGGSATPGPGGTAEGGTAEGAESGTAGGATGPTGATGSGTADGGTSQAGATDGDGDGTNDGSGGNGRPGGSG
jgi:Zn-dependent protease with chaperone function